MRSTEPGWNHFMPSVNAIDGFQFQKAAYEQRVMPYIPFSSFAEAYIFGFIYFAFFWSIIFFAASSVNAIARYGVALMLISLGLFLVGWFMAGQYPIRNGVRYFYVVIALRYVVAWRAERRQRSIRRSARRDIKHPKVTFP